MSRGWDKSEKVFSLDRGEEKNEKAGRGKEDGKTDGEAKGQRGSISVKEI